MYEDKTYENIMKEMIKNMPNDVNTEEGSLIWNACAKQALQLEEAYRQMQAVEDNLYTDTQDEEHLILSGKDKGVKIKVATCAELKAVFSQDIEMGTRFTTNDMDYEVVDKIAEFTYKIKCEEAGKIGNIASGELTPIDFVDDYNGGRITELITPGEEQEDTEEYREKILRLNDANYFGGNRADYERFIEAISGIGAVKVKRREEGEEYIYPILLNSEYKIPSTGLIEEVQTEIDPEKNHGQGAGTAPIGHKVIILPAIGKTIDIEAVISYENGFSQAAIQTHVNNAIENYFAELAKTWKNTQNITVRISRIESRLLAIEGILDISETKLNGISENMILKYEEIPVRGTINGI